jgi:hypothetical protein
MTWYRVARITGLFLLVLWAAGVVVVLSALAGIEAAEHTEQPTPTPRSSWVAR